MPSEKKFLHILIYSKFAHYKNDLLFVDWFLFHYYIMTCNEVIIQITIMQKQWEP